MAFGSRLKNAWDAFLGRDPTKNHVYQFGASRRPDRRRIVSNNLRTILSSIYTQIAVDCSLLNINQVRLDENGRFKEVLHTDLNRALTIEANVDQTGRELIREAVTLMLDEGCVAIVPTSTNVDPETTDGYKIYEIRVGRVKEWLPREVRVELYNEKTGEKKELLLAKSFVAIIENPFYGIMNESNSTAQRLVRTLAQLDRMNDRTTSGRLDMIVQLPYKLNTEAKRIQAENRKDDIERQLTDSTYGIAYVDTTEKIIQLNRPLENNLWEQAKALQEQLFAQLGFTKAIFDGTADEATMLNYNNRIIEPILTAITEEMTRKWISKTAQSQGQSIQFFDVPFRLVPLGQLAELVDKLTRNEILTSNEVRGIIGMKPINDPKADSLRNANLNHPEDQLNNGGEDVSKILNELNIQNEKEEEDEV